MENGYTAATISVSRSSFFVQIFGQPFSTSIIKSKKVELSE